MLLRRSTKFGRRGGVFGERAQVLQVPFESSLYGIHGKLILGNRTKKNNAGWYSLKVEKVWYNKSQSVKE